MEKMRALLFQATGRGRRWRRRRWEEGGVLEEAPD
jgi:hypothetical protein